MIKDVIIRVEGLGKKYLLGRNQSSERYTALRDVLTNFAKSPLRQWRNGTAGVASREDEEFWALRDVNLEVRRGEVVGIIGRNGAGKSTLLKVLSRITEPTEGRVTLKGRVASLLEVGTGFHPELTGRENIFLNGAILGMSRVEIKAKFDEIIAFAEVEKFLDTPVKRYSSGMYVRLAFAVAAHLDPEILIVDEVLAVGDAQFQKKCLGKMGTIAHQSGRTVLFVSHNMGAVNQLCDSCILLENGSLKLRGIPREVITRYSEQPSANLSTQLAHVFRGPLAKVLRVTRLHIGRQDGTALVTLSPEEEIHIYVEIEILRRIPGFRTTLSIFAEGVRLFSLNDVDEPVTAEPGSLRAVFVIPAFLLRPGDYNVAVGGHDVNTGDWFWGSDLTTFSVIEEWSHRNPNYNTGLVNVDGKPRRDVLLPSTPRSQTA